ncbi:polysaccharide pyruvyl transferase family protein [Rhodococcus sp. NPDC058514]|uniref:polysaccharide pyruvyl transferase family protein n=1 Tax=unclassified Rhodococcus (in: high G+C Gram-positive bacteria) TaxID=192944 RepID=UPI003657F5DD
MHSALDQIQSSTTAILTDLVEAGPSAALLDYPDYVNSGDSMIYAGQLTYLRALGLRVDYVCTTTSYDRTALESATSPSATVFLQGGGNFGDRWPLHQKFRERVIQELPHRKIVQLPQSIDFESPGSLCEAQEVYRRHPDLTILIRDRPGAALTADLFPDNRVEFCPDLAFGLGPLAATREATHDVLLLKRSDKESTSAAEDFRLTNRSVHQTDWHLAGFSGWKWTRMLQAENLLALNPAIRTSSYPMRRRFYDSRIETNIGAAVSILSRGRVVVTDRLHAAVLASLMGKPVVMTDNVTKKVSAIYADYLRTMPETHLVSDFTEAGAVAESLLAH